MKIIKVLFLLISSLWMQPLFVCAQNIEEDETLGSDIDTSKSFYDGENYTYPRWKITFSNGDVIEIGEGAHTVKFTFKYEDKLYYFMIYNVDLNRLGAREVVKQEQKKLTINQERYYADDIWIAFNEGFDLPIEKIDKIIKDVFLKRFAMGDYVRESILWYKVKYEGNNRHWQVVSEYYKGKYLTNEEYRARIKAEQAEQNAKDKVGQAKVAQFTKRFGFDPTKKSIKQLVTAGRDFQLLRDYLIFLNSDGDLKYHSGGKYAINLSIDKGASKCYDLIKGNTLGGNELFNRVRLCYFWVKNGKISSVSWY